MRQRMMKNKMMKHAMIESLESDDNVIQPPNYTMEEDDTLFIDGLRFDLVEDTHEEGFLVLKITGDVNIVRNRMFKITLWHNSPEGHASYDVYDRSIRNAFRWISNIEVPHNTQYTYVFGFYDNLKSFTLEFFMDRELMFIKDKFIMTFEEIY